MIRWRIIEGKSNGKIEYQVSDGDVGKRTISYDTYDKQQAVTWLKEENVGCQKELST